MHLTLLVLQSLAVLAAILVGVRFGGVGIGLWGALGTLVLVFGFGLPLGSPPIDALLIIIAVVVTTSTMQACGGIDAMVLVAARIILRRPRAITVVAPLVSLLLAALAGTSNILFSLLPVIKEASVRARVRPDKPLVLSVVATSIALAASPVSAAMAAMLTVLADRGEDDWNVLTILAITAPAAFLGVLASCLLLRGSEESSRLDEPTTDQGRPDPLAELEARATTRGRVTALVYLAGIALVVLLGLVQAWRPLGVDGKSVSVAALIQLVMLACGAVIALVGRADLTQVPSMSIFRGGMVAAVAFFGLAWMLDTFLKAHTSSIAAGLARSVGRWPLVMVLAVFLVAVLTTSQSTATRMILPIALASGLPVPLALGLWVGSLGGIYLLPTNGLQIAAAELDDSGRTRLGTRLVDNSFFVPSLVVTVLTTLAGGAIGWALVGLR